MNSNSTTIIFIHFYQNCGTVQKLKLYRSELLVYIEFIPLLYGRNFQLRDVMELLICEKDHS